MEKDAMKARLAQSHGCIAVGFDGFIDTLMRPVMRMGESKPNEYYPTIPALGQYLAGQGGKSCSIGLDVAQRRIGGNAPLLAMAAHALGQHVSLIGMLGDGALDEAYAGLPFEQYSYMAVGQAMALEFDDGKVFLAPNLALAGDAWDTLARKAGAGAVQALKDAALIAMVNWSELPWSGALWQGVLEHCLMAGPSDKARYVFADLADVTRKAAGAVDAVLSLLGQMAAWRTVVLSLNENEARVVGQRVLDGPEDMARTAAGLREKYGIDEVLVHARRETLLCTPRGTTGRPVQVIDKPVISTGAGDNFNAASCTAVLAGLGDAERLAFAGQYVHRYLTLGHSPTLEEL